VATSPSGVAATPALARPVLLKWGAAAIAVVVLGGIAIWMRSPLPPPKLTGSRAITNDGFQKFNLTTDGSRLYFGETTMTNFTIAQVAGAGGETGKVDVPIANPILLDVSSDQTELLVGEAGVGINLAGGAYWAVPMPAGSPRRLGDAAGRDATWAPDGRLVFAKGSDFYAADHNGNDAKKLLTEPGTLGAQSFSPDGSRMRYSVFNQVNNTATLWEANSDGTSAHQLLKGWNDPPGECCGKWTADGRYFLFVSFRRGSSDIWIMADKQPWWRKASEEAVQLTTGPLQYSNPLPSKDGKTLYVVGQQPRAELVKYDAKSGELVPFLGGISAGDVDFARDGQWVAYVSYPDGTLWRSKTDGSERLQLTHAPMQTALAHWSPDSKLIAFAASAPGKPWEIFLIGRDGGSPQQVSNEEDGIAADPTWSPDGKTLGYGVQKMDTSFIKLYDLSAHQAKQLAGSEKIFAPRWSPDGRYMATITQGNGRLVLYDVKNEKWTPLNKDLGAIGYLTWSHDSAWVNFDTALNKEPGYYRLRVSDLKLEKLVEFGKTRFFPGQFGGGPWTGLGPGDVPLFPRDISTQEIYAFDLHLP
jgi:Tol biopolymer transport system component